MSIFLCYGGSKTSSEQNNTLPFAVFILLKGKLLSQRSPMMERELKAIESEKKVKVKSLSASDSFQPNGVLPTRLLHPWNFPGKSTGVGCHFLLQGIFLTQGLNPDLPYCRQTLYCLSHWGLLVIGYF